MKIKNILSLFKKGTGENEKKTEEPASVTKTQTIHQKKDDLSEIKIYYPLALKMMRAKWVKKPPLPSEGMGLLGLCRETKISGVTITHTCGQTNACGGYAWNHVEVEGVKNTLLTEAFFLALDRNKLYESHLKNRPHARSAWEWKEKQKKDSHQAVLDKLLK